MSDTSVHEIASRNAAARSTLNRWADWSEHCVVRWRRIGPTFRLGVWAGDWVGPLGGRYTFVGLTKPAIQRRIRRELARWDRHRRG